jgi:hypothetical protein
MVEKMFAAGGPIPRVSERRFLDEAEKVIRAQLSWG